MSKIMICLKKIYNEFVWMINTKKNKQNGSRYILNGFFVPNKIYICRAQLGYGLVAVLRNYIFVYHWAKERGYAVVLDYEDKYIYEQGLLGVHSFWDLLFEQDITVNDALQKRGVIVGNVNLFDGSIPEMCRSINGIETDTKIRLERDNWREYYQNIHEFLRPLWRPKNEYLKAADQFYSTYIGSKRCLGVAVREMFAKSAELDKLAGESKNMMEVHPLTASMEDIIEDIEDYIDSNGLECLFLSTSQEDTCQKFKNKFGDRVYWIERARDQDVNWEYQAMDDLFGLSKEEFYKKRIENGSDHIAGKNKGYLLELLLLSRCNSLYAMPGGSAIGALMINGGVYENIYIVEDINDNGGY